MNSVPSAYYVAMNYRTDPGPRPIFVVATHVTAISEATGEVLWTYELPAVARRFAVNEATLVVLDGDGVLHCFATRTGALVGRVTLLLQTANGLLVDGERIYVTSDNELVALDRGGNILWRTTIPRNKAHSLCGLAILDGPQMQPDFSKG